MKTMFTRLFTIAVVSTLTLTSFAVKAQTNSLTDGAVPAATIAAAPASVVTEVKPEAKAKAEVKAPVKAAEDTSWKPQRRIWGYTFGDFYYDAHADKGNRGSETNYNGVPQYRNAFQFRRLYLGYDYEITKKFKAEVLLASEPSANTSASGTTSIQNGDNLVDGKMAFWIKNFNLRVRDLWTGTDLVIGEMSTPGFALNEPGTNGATSLSEATWGYRSIEKTVSDFHKTNSYDVGLALQGTFDPTTKNYGYVFMVGNNSTSSLSSASNANTGFYKIFYGDLWGKFLNKKLLIDIYADYVRTNAATATIGGQSHNVLKGFVAYTTPKLTVGVEAYTQKITNGVSNTSTTPSTPSDATVNAISVFVKGTITKDKLGFFARYDGYNPNTDFISADNYATNTNFGSYNPNFKETFITAGLDFTPAKNIHFMPNVWLVNYKDQRDPSVTGYVASDHTLVYRATFYFVFGK
jgi:hypothetical protein